EDVGMSSERLARLRAGMQRDVDRGPDAGLATLAARRARAGHFEGIASRGVEAESPLTPDTLFPSASMPKPSASGGLMRLSDEGHCLINDPIWKYLPEYANMKVAQAASPAEANGAPYKLVPAKNPITFKHVLTHTAGFPNTYRGITREEYDKTYPRKNPNE